MVSIQIVLFDGFDLLDAIAPYEVFHAASMNVKDNLSVEFVTAEGPRSVKSGVNDVLLEAEEKLDPTRPGIILVPGAAGAVDGEGPDSIPAILGRAMNTELTRMVEHALHQKDMVIAGVCGGSLLLAMGGLLEGRHGVTHHLGMDALAATGVTTVQARVVDDGNFVSSGGVTSGLDLALYLVERELGPRIAHAVEQLFEFERRGTVWRDVGLVPRHGTAKAEDDENSTTNKVGHTDSAMLNQSRIASIFEGEWATEIMTPIGKLDVALSISTDKETIRGKATQGEETVQFIHPVIQGNKLTWSLPITKPLRLNLKFEVSVDGDKMIGTAKAGVLPASKLIGKRIL
ncbi:DJ-1/PfpI family protein [Shouchella clausii]|uniref:Thiamine biosynthesis protein ThiJ n=1 Tax=Shouchella clausii TaxID=79880 RepID=A0A268NY53_SHOCL|nr:DJ-1/PfpI family protein [Shouchella clausii]PAE88446.1 thiamine biosynthesis protein ThiJ [Shouchella clausii]